MNVDTGEFRALTERVTVLEDDIAALTAAGVQLAAQLAEMAQAEAIIRRASANVPGSVLYPEAKRPRPGHLRPVP